MKKIVELFAQTYFNDILYQHNEKKVIIMRRSKESLESLPAPLIIKNRELFRDNIKKIIIEESVCNLNKMRFFNNNIEILTEEIFFDDCIKVSNLLKDIGLEKNLFIKI